MRSADGYARGWLDDVRIKTMGDTGLARAIDYTLKCWPALVRVLDDGRYPIDNNVIENVIRPVTLGRKNWLFAGSETAGRRAAAIMSLLASAEASSRTLGSPACSRVYRPPSTATSTRCCRWHNATPSRKVQLADAYHPRANPTADHQAP